MKKNEVLPFVTIWMNLGGITLNKLNQVVQFSSVQSLSRVLTLRPHGLARQASLSITNSQKLLKLMSIESVMPSNHLILCHPLLLLPSIFPSIRKLFDLQCCITFCDMFLLWLSFFITSFLLELFLHSSPAAYWIPTNLGSSPFSVIYFCLFILFVGFSRQECQVVCHSLLQWTT